MKANRRYLRDQDDAASVIVGAVLLFALSFLVLVMIQSNFVPVWEQDAEAAHAQTVRSQMTYLKSQMERQVQDTITNPLSSPIDLDRQSVRDIFGNRFIPPGTLTLGNVNSRGFEIGSPELSLTTTTDLEFVGLGESWDPIDGDKIEDASKVASIRVRFGADAQPHTGEEATITITDANGDYAGHLEIRLMSMATNGPGINKASFWVQTFRADGELINAKQVDELDQQVPNGEEPPFVWIYALEPVYWFDRVLAAAEAPFDIEFVATGGLPAEFSATYLQETPGGGTILVGGGTEIITGYEKTTIGTSLEYNSLPQYFVDQDLILEYGALILAQEGGSVVTSSPAFSVSSVGNFTHVSWTVPLIDNNEEGYTAQGTGLVITTASDHQVVTATAPQVNFTIDTDHPDAWTIFWTNALEDDGLTEGDEFDVLSSSSSVTLRIYGPRTDDVHDVSLSLQTANIQVFL